MGGDANKPKEKLENAERAKDQKEISPSDASKQERASVALDVTEGKSKKEIAARLEELKSNEYTEKSNKVLFENIDVNESAESQKGALYELAGSSMFELIPTLLQKGIKIGDIENFSIFSNTPSGLDQLLSAKNAQGTADCLGAFKKINEILNSSKSDKDSVKGVFMENWKRMVELASKSYVSMKPVLESGSVETAPKEGEKQGFWDKHGKTITYGVLGIGLVAGAYYVADKTWDKVTGKDEKTEKEDSGFFNKLFKGVAGVGLLMGIGFGLGRLTETKTIKKWLKSLGIADSKIIKALGLLSHGEFKKAQEALFEDDKNEENCKKIAEKIGQKMKGKVDPDTIEKISDVPFLDLMPQGFWGNLTKNLEDKAVDFFKKLPVIREFTKDDPNFKKDIQTIAHFIDLPENQEKLKKINPGSEMTVLDVLKILCNLEQSPSINPDTSPAVLAAAPVGAIAMGIDKKREQENTQKEGNKKTVINKLTKDKKLESIEVKLLEADVQGFMKIIEKAESIHGNWLTRELEFYHKFFNSIPGKEPGDEAYLAFKKTFEEKYKPAGLQPLRTMVGGIEKDLEILKKGNPISEVESTRIKKDISEFYEQYSGISNELLSLQQNLASKYQEREEQTKNKDWYKQLDWSAGVELVGNTAFGMPISVFMREENGKIVTMLGIASVVTGGWGLIGTRGGVLKRIGGGLWGTTAPVRYLSYKGLESAKQGIEYLDFMKHSGLLTEVQKGKMTVSKAIEEMNAYLHLYGKTWSGSDIVDYKKGFIEEAKSLGRKSELSGEQTDAVRDELKFLEDLKKNKIETWTEAVKAKKVAGSNTAIDIKETYTIKEEKIIAEEVEIMKKSQSAGTYKGAAGEEEILRELAIEKLQKEGKIKTLEEMQTALKGSLAKEKIEGLTVAEKIEKIKATSKEADLYLEKTVIRIKEMRASKVSEQEIQAFADKSMTHLKDLRTDFNPIFAGLKEASKTMSPDEAKAFKELVTKELTHAKGIRGIAREMKGRGKFALVFGVANVVLESYEVSKKSNEERIQKEIIDIAGEIGLDTLQIVLDVMSPFGISDWYTVFWGKEALTGKEATTSERITRGLFGTYNLVADALAVAGGVVTAEGAGAGGAAIYAGENAVEIALRSASKSKLIYGTVQKLMPKIALLAKDAGGYKNLFKIVKSEKMTKALELMQKTKKVTGTAMIGLAAVDVAKVTFAGYQILFDTKDQPEHELTFDFEDKEKKLTAAKAA